MCIFFYLELSFLIQCITPQPDAIPALTFFPDTERILHAAIPVPMLPARKTKVLIRRGHSSKKLKDNSKKKPSLEIELACFIPSPNLPPRVHLQLGLYLFCSLVESFKLKRGTLRINTLLVRADGMINPFKTVIYNRLLSLLDSQVTEAAAYLVCTERRILTMDALSVGDIMRTSNEVCAPL